VGVNVRIGCVIWYPPFKCVKDTDFINLFLNGHAGLPERHPTSLFRRETLPWEAAFLAGQAFVRYKRRGGTKKRILADFLIGAHATVAGMGIISRDTGYSRYFTVEVLNPAEKKK